jgi:hypothetical protein
VKCADREVLHSLFADELIQSRAHLAGGFIRKRNGEDLVRRDAVFVNQVGDPVCEHARLAAARSGQHEYGTFY